MYPEDCVQYLVEPKWWEKDQGKDLRRGRLVRAYIPISDQVPNKLTVVGRDNPRDHNTAYFKIEPSRIHQKTKKPGLPVAATPQFENEEFGVYRVKKRPAIVIADGSEEVPAELIRGKSKRHTSPMVLLAPSFGCDEGQKRDGYSQAFVDRVRRCHFPQFFWDKVPLSGASESIIRFDQIQPMGKHQDAIEITEYCLSREALEVLDDWLYWYCFETVPEDGVLAMVREAVDLS